MPIKKALKALPGQLSVAQFLGKVGSDSLSSDVSTQQPLGEDLDTQWAWDAIHSVPGILPEPELTDAMNDELMNDLMNF